MVKYLTDEMGCNRIWTVLLRRVERESTMTPQKKDAVVGATLGGAVGGFVGALIAGPVGAVFGAAVSSYVGPKVARSLKNRG